MLGAAVGGPPHHTGGFSTPLRGAFGPRNSIKNGHYRETCGIGGADPWSLAISGWLLALVGHALACQASVARPWADPPAEGFSPLVPGLQGRPGVICSDRSEERRGGEECRCR